MPQGKRHRGLTLLRAAAHWHFSCVEESGYPGCCTRLCPISTCCLVWWLFSPPSTLLSGSGFFPTTSCSQSSAFTSAFWCIAGATGKQQQGWSTMSLPTRPTPLDDWPALRNDGRLETQKTAHRPWTLSNLFGHCRSARKRFSCSSCLRAASYSCLQSSTLSGR